MANKWQDYEVVYDLRNPTKSKRQDKNAVCGAYYISALSGLRCEACNVDIPHQLRRFDAVDAHCATPEHQARMKALYTEVPITNLERLLGLYQANLPEMPDLMHLTEDPNCPWHMKCGLCNTGFEWDRMEKHIDGTKHQVAVRRLARQQKKACCGTLRMRKA